MSSISDDSFLVHLHKKRLQFFLAQDCENGFFDISFDIDGHILHAHKFVIASISETFKELFRKQSSSSFNADPIPIDNCSFKDFRAFVLFAYTGEWTLMTNERILKMLQIAFVYQSEEFHQKCDIYLSKITFTVESFYHFYDSLADCMCILPRFKKVIKAAMKKLYPELLDSERFILAKRETVKALVYCERKYLLEEQLFKLVCKWVENQAFANAVCNVKEYRILQLSQILPFIHFESMSSDFMMDVVIRNGDLFGFNTLSNIVRKQIHHDVEITDINGRKMCGTMFDRNNIIDKIKDIKSEAWIDKNGCHWDFVKPFFYDKSKYSMKKGNAKYQLLIENGHLLVTSSSSMKGNEYFLAELIADDSFVFEECKICVF